MERPAESALVKRISDFNCSISLDQFLDKAIKDILVDEESSQTGASLTASANSSKSASLECHFQVCIFHNNGCIVSSKFKQSLSESLIHLLLHDFTDFS